jgi:phosphatidylglycerol:prolipoprotein diacylglycerol transferase
MCPTFSLGSLDLNSYPLMLGLAVVVLAIGIRYRMRRRCLMLADSIYDFVDFLFWLLVGAFAGGRLTGTLPNLATCLLYRGDCAGWWRGGIHWLGFVGFGSLVGYVYLGSRDLSRGEYFDAVAPIIPLALAVARVGCLLAGCCYGRVTTASPGMVLPDVHGVWARRYPTRLASMAANLLIVALLLTFERHTVRGRDRPAGWPFPGFLFLLYVELYCAQRFYFQFWRADMPQLLGPFTWTHLYCVIGIGLATGLIVHRLSSAAGPSPGVASSSAKNRLGG